MLLSNVFRLGRRLQKLKEAQSAFAYKLMSLSRLFFLLELLSVTYWVTDHHQILD